MYVPASTYRIQLNSTFPFHKLKEIIPYLKKLGISTVYSAPFFSSTPGSTHGYDGINPEMINPEIGTIEEFVEISALLKSQNMGWLQDIVPNHMAFDPNNEWLMDIFEKGKHSEYANYFDINWQHPNPSVRGKVLAPFLGASVKEVLEKKELKFLYHQHGFYLEYGSLRFPLSWVSYYDILKGIILPDPFQDEFQHLLDDFLLVKNNFDDPEIVATSSHLKEILFGFYVSQSILKESIDQHLLEVSSDLDLFNSILSLQFFELDYYGKSDTLINYRRFFVINQLICLKIEDDKVFEHYHRFVKTLIDLHLINGVRVDHIDGLSHPKQYLEKLRALAGGDSYIIVEKILASEENMPVEWPVQGASGYEFLSVVNNLFTKKESQARFCQIYKDFSGLDSNFEELVREKKAYMLKKRMGGEQENLLALFLGCQLEITKVWHKNRLKEALFQVLISFPVYRSYVDPQFYSDTDIGLWRKAFQTAVQHNPDLLEELLLLETALSKEGMQNENNLKFMMRLQQFTGPLAAKGVEDTVFYVHNCLLSHNEVGDSSISFGMSTEDFHIRMKERKALLPFSMNTLSTHDTKRGEDARARINVLTEIPEEWAQHVFQWKEINKKHKTRKGQEEMPHPNDEYFIYQSLIGGFPMEAQVTEEFKKRLKDFLLKALREAKVYTDYPDYNTDYENATLQFIDSILAEQEFLNDFVPFFIKVSDHAILLSLAQTLVKNTAPGVPDTYQGSELWELSFVDPDNRREINFVERARLLDKMIAEKDVPHLLQDLLQGKRDGRIKLFTTWRSLSLRVENEVLFREGDYVPLEFSGEKAALLVGYGIRYQEQWILTLFPREAIALSSSPSANDWADTILHLPEKAPKNWTNAFTAEPLENISSKWRIQDVLSLFPVALFKSN